jgi:capsular exopolysaccharide synthesis family protein
VLLILGLSVAILFVFALESLDRGFRSGDQIEALTGVRSLGLVPVLDRSTLAAGTSPQAYVADQPSSLFGESLRSIYTGILISGNRPTPRSILVTSSQPDEGKSTITACLGRMCAISGIRTLIVEADLRKPSLHRMLEAPPTPGIVEYFLGDAQISDLFFEDMTSGAWFLPAGKLVVDPVRVLASPEIGRLFSIIEDRFDLVLVDSPPLMAVADARILAPIVDTSVFVVRWGKTHRDVVRLGLKTLLETGGHLSGVILSRVDAKRQAEYGFGDSGYYYRNVKSYYTR